MRPRDYKAREVYHDILQDLIPNIEALELKDNAVRYTSISLIHPRNGKKEQIGRVTKITNLKMHFATRCNAGKKEWIEVRSWNDLRQNADVIREYAKEFLGC